MVIVQVKNFGAGSNSPGAQERKRSRAQPPEGWIGESRQVKKRQVSSRLQHLLTISGGEDQVSNGSRFDSDDSPSPAPPRPSSVLLSPSRKDANNSKQRPMSDIWPISPSRGETRSVKPPSPKLSPKVRKKEPVAEEKEDWKDTMKRMRDQIKAVQELPKVEVPKSLVKTVTSASSPDLTLYSSTSKLSRVEASWEIRARYRNMRTEELYQSQLVKKSGYSWRDKVPEIQNTKLKFTEPRNNVVTDMNFIGSTYVQEKEVPLPKKEVKEEDLSKCPKIMTKSYRVDPSFDMSKLQIIDRLRPRQEIQPDITCRLYCFIDNQILISDLLFKLMNFFNFRWQLAITLPGWPPKPPPLPVIMEVEEEPVPEKPPETPVPAGDIKTKMTGAIASMATVKKAKPLEKPAPKPDAPKLGGAMPSGGGTADWRSEVKKRDRAKQQEKLNAMPQGMPDYREPEKGTVFDWRAKLKEEEKDNDPKNMWKKFDSAGPMKVRAPPPMKPKPKSVLPPKEEPCTCNVGICKVHVKFALKKSNSAPKSVAPPVEEPLKRKASVKKKPDSSKSAKIEAKKESPEKVKPGVVNTLPPVEKEEFTIKIINFVAIKVAVEEPGPARRRSVKKRRESEDSRRGSKGEPGLMEKPPLPAMSPPPLPRDPSPPSPSPPPPKSPTPVRDPTPPPPPPPPPPREPTPPPPPPPPKSPTPPSVRVPKPAPPKKPSPPTSPAYQRKFFPNPVPSEPYKPKIRDIPVAKTTRRKRVEDYVEEVTPLRRREVNMDVKPVKFSGVAENCIKKALFLGNQYVGEGKSKVELEVKNDDKQRRSSKQESRRSSTLEASSRRSSQSRRVSYYESGTETETGRSRSNSKTPLRDSGQDSRPKKKKTKASTKIIDILTAKKMKDELSAGETTENGGVTPKQTRRRLSEYVSEKLRLDNSRSSKSRSNTPVSPPRLRRTVQMR